MASKQDRKISNKKTLRVVGIMSGTSIDGADFVLTRIHHPDSVKSGTQICQFKDMASVAFPRSLRERLMRAASHELQVDELSLLHFDLGRFYAQSLEKIAEKKSWSFDLVGMHGQTVHHLGGRASLQIGEPSFLADKLGTPVVSDFRSSDVAVGGQGAPLATAFHRIAFQHRFKGEPYAFHNLGGISNCSMMNKSGKVEKSFDTGPANILMDLLCRKFFDKTYDRDGRIAAKGIVLEDILKAAMSYSYYSKNPPKSCGREEFGMPYLNKYFLAKARRPEDLLCTAAELTALSIARAYQKWSPKGLNHVVFAGGGALNPFLMKRIAAHLPGFTIETSEDFGWSSKAIEGGAFALFAAFRVWGLPAHEPQTTGASRKVVLGKLTEL